MSHQTKIFGLRSLAAQIDNEKIKLLGSMPKPGDAGFIDLERKIDGWKQQIKGIERDLKSQSHFNQMIFEKNRFGADAYAAKQRFNSREANVKDLSGALGDVALALVDLIQTLYGGPNGEARALEGMKHALSNWLKTVKHSEEGALGAVPFNVQDTVQQVQVRAAGPAPMDGPMPGPGPIDIFTLILAYFVLLKSLHKKG